MVADAGWGGWPVRDVRGGVVGAGVADGDGDEALLRRVASGDPGALATLYRRHGARLLAYLTGLTGDQGLAEELVQDTLVAAWRAAGRFRGEASVGTWLFAIGRRRAAGRRRRFGNELAAGGEALIEQQSAEPGPEAVVLARADLQRVRAAIPELSATHREVLHLVFVQGLSLRETAMVTGVPVGTVKSRLSNARRALAEALRQGEDGEP